jgi:hypothetical protein
MRSIQSIESMLTFRIPRCPPRMRNIGLEFRKCGKAAANDATVPRPRVGTIVLRHFSEVASGMIGLARGQNVDRRERT